MQIHKHNYKSKQASKEDCDATTTTKKCCKTYKNVLNHQMRCRLRGNAKHNRCKSTHVNKQKAPAGLEHSCCRDWFMQQFFSWQVCSWFATVVCLPSLFCSQHSWWVSIHFYAAPFFVYTVILFLYLFRLVIVWICKLFLLFPCALGSCIVFEPCQPQFL